MPGTVISAVRAIGANELNVKIRVVRSCFHAWNRLDYSKDRRYLIHHALHEHIEIG